MSEIWKPVPGYPSYEVSDHGNVRSITRTITRTSKYGKVSTFEVRGQNLRPGYTRGGYGQVKLFNGSRETKRQRPIHQLVAEAFLGPKPAHGTYRVEVRHLDDDKTNNHVGNLAWGTGSQNQRDAVTNGKNARTKVTHCPKGHEYDQDNTYTATRAHNGRRNRHCKKCSSERQKQYWEDVYAGRRKPPKSLADRCPKWSDNN